MDCVLLPRSKSEYPSKMEPALMPQISEGENLRML